MIPIYLASSNGDTFEANACTRSRIARASFSLIFEVSFDDSRESTTSKKVTLDLSLDLPRLAARIGDFLIKID